MGFPLNSFNKEKETEKTIKEVKKCVRLGFGSLSVNGQQTCKALEPSQFILTVMAVIFLIAVLSLQN